MSETELELRGQPPSPEGQYWRTAFQDLRKGSIERVERAAGQLIALVTLLSGLYFNAIAFGQVPKDYVLVAGPLRPDLRVLFVGPLVLWALVLLAAVMVVLPRGLRVSPYDPAEIEQVIVSAVRWKYRWLIVSLVLLVISIAWMVAAAWVYLEAYVVKP